MKRFFFRICLFFVFLLLIWWGIALYESNHIYDDYEEMIWTNVSHPRDEYEVTDWGSHLAYLETFNRAWENIRYLDRWPRSGKVIVLLHWTPTNSWLWRKIVPWLIEAGYRVIVPDMLWFGASSMPDSASDLTSDQQSEVLIWLLDNLWIQTFSIAGHDQWSLRVWETITRHPERIEKLIVFNSIWDRDGFHPPAWFGEKNISTSFTVWAMWSKPLWRIFAYGAMLGWLKSKRVATTTMINGYLFPLFHGMSTTYEAFITNFSRIEGDLSLYQAKFPDVDISTMIVWWSHDKILVWEEQIPVLQELLKIKESDIHLLDAAHFVQEEVPDEIVWYMTNFLD